MSLLRTTPSCYLLLVVLLQSTPTCSEPSPENVPNFSHVCRRFLLVRGCPSLPCWWWWWWWFWLPQRSQPKKKKLEGGLGGRRCGLCCARHLLATCRWWCCCNLLPRAVSRPQKMSPIFRTCAGASSLCGVVHPFLVGGGGGDGFGCRKGASPKKKSWRGVGGEGAAPPPQTPVTLLRTTPSCYLSLVVLLQSTPTCSEPSPENVPNFSHVCRRFLLVRGSPSLPF